MNKDDKGTAITVPAFKHCKELRLRMGSWQAAQDRMHETKNLVPANYSSLEFTIQEAWREAKSNCIQIGDAIKKAKQNVSEIKADVILDEIPELLKNSPKNANNADFRNAVLARNEDYKSAVEHLEKLEAMLLHFESHMDTMKETSRFIKKQMDYIIRTGTSSGISQR